MKNEKTAQNSKTIEISDNPKPAEKKPEKSKKPQKPNKSNKKLIIICIFIAIFVAGGITGLMILLNKKSGSGPTSTNSGSQTPEIQRYYSNLSGLEIPDEKLNDSPIFCIQPPCEQTPRLYFHCALHGRAFNGRETKPTTAWSSREVTISTIFLSSGQSLSHVSLQPHGLQHTRLPCPSPFPKVFSNSHPLSQ